MTLVDRPNPEGPICLASTNIHSAQQVAIDSANMSLMNEKGFAMARATHGFDFGTWYFEVEIPIDSPGHFRIGVSQILGEAQAPVGYDEYSYAYRDKDGAAMHCGKSKPYGAPYGPGDTIGVKIVLPRDVEAVKIDDSLRDQIETAYSPKRLGTYKVRQEILGDSSHFEFILNGQSQGIAFGNIYQGKYYPAISLYGGARCKVNFGPEFRFPCPPDSRPACDISG